MMPSSSCVLNICPRSLSSRQRELLQAYVDDVEGRPSQSSNTSGDSQASSDANKEQGTKNSFATDNPSGGWLSRASRSLRDKLGR